MSKPVHKVNLSDVQAVVEHAKRTLQNMPTNVYLPGMSRILTEGERLGLAYFVGALYVAGSHGTDTSGYAVILSHQDSEASE